MGAPIDRRADPYIGALIDRWNDDKGGTQRTTAEAARVACAESPSVTQAMPHIPPFPRCTAPPFPSFPR